ncbi:hypothetical protein NFI96_032185, partial [Prochilodus magdalenae]
PSPQRSSDVKSRLVFGSNSESLCAWLCAEGLNLSTSGDLRFFVWSGMEERTAQRRAARRGPNRIRSQHKESDANHLQVFQSHAGLLPDVLQLLLLSLSLCVCVCPAPSLYVLDWVQGMEADQNQEVPEAVAEAQAPNEESPASEQPKPEEAEETSAPPAESPQNPPEDTQVNTSDPEKAEAEPAEAKAAPDAAVEPVKATENAEEVAAEQEKPSEVEKPAEDEKKSENEVVEQKPTEPVEPEKKAEVTEKTADQSEQKVEGEAAVAAATAAAQEPAGKADAPASEAETEKPSEAEGVQAELPKETAQQPKEAELPLFFGWFLLSEVEERIKCSTMDFLKTLDTLEAFKKHLNEFTGEAEKEVDLEQYFQTQGPLHCTAKFCDYGKTAGSKEYAELQVVKDSYGSSTELSVVGLMVTPRTFGARVELTPEQLKLWPEGADKEGVPEASLPDVEALPVGSRAHVTLGCAAKVEAVQTGLDLLEILALQKGGQEALATEELELGTLSYLGQGRWYLTLREAVTCDTTFSSFSEDKRPAEPAKKEGGEKKKKPKCSIL